jgi:hypothetical protein
MASNANENNSNGSAPSAPRSLTGLSSALAKFTAPGTRGEFERHRVEEQCRLVLGPPNAERSCWLCGFPIGKWARLAEETAGKKVSMENPMLDRAVCEHVLPVKLGHGVLELLYLARDPISERLLHTEYEYAHNHCNYIKNSTYFATLPLDATDFCELSLNEEKVDKVLYRIFHDERMGAQSSVVKILYKGKKLRFPNPVQAYCFSNNIDSFTADPETYFATVWAPFAKRLILAKMARVIKYIKEADMCGEAAGERGTHFAGLEARLREGLPKMGRYPKVNGVTQYPGRVLTRSPSINNILAGMNAERLRAFQAGNLLENVGSYLSNNSNSGSPSGSDPRSASPSSPNESPVVRKKAAKQRRKPAVAALARNLSNNEEAEPSVIITRARRKPTEAERAAGAGEEEPVVAKPVLHRQLGTRRLTNRSTSPENNRNTNTMAARRRRGAFRRTAKASTRGRLLLEPKANGIYVSGNTYPRKNNLKALGGLWRGNLKQWVLPVGTNTSTLE